MLIIASDRQLGREKNAKMAVASAVCFHAATCDVSMADGKKTRFSFFLSFFLSLPLSLSLDRLSPLSLLLLALLLHPTVLYKGRVIG